MSAVSSKQDPKFEKKIQQMENLLLHSACGIHALFKNQEIKNAINHKKITVPLAKEDHKKIESLIASLIEQPSLFDKINYLNSLDADSHTLVVHTYLEIIEGALRNMHPQIH